MDKGLSNGAKGETCRGWIVPQIRNGIASGAKCRGPEFVKYADPIGGIGPWNWGDQCSITFVAKAETKIADKKEDDKKDADKKDTVKKQDEKKDGEKKEPREDDSAKKVPEKKDEKKEEKDSSDKTAETKEDGEKKDQPKQTPKKGEDRKKSLVSIKVDKASDEEEEDEEAETTKELEELLSKADALQPAATEDQTNPASFDPKGKSVSTGKPITGWLWESLHNGRIPGIFGVWAIGTKDHQWNEGFRRKDLVKRQRSWWRENSWALFCPETDNRYDQIWGPKHLFDNIFPNSSRAYVKCTVE